MRANWDQVTSAFRARLPAAHPDVAAYTATPWLQAAADAQAETIEVWRGSCVGCGRSPSVLGAGGRQPLVEPDGLVSVGAARG